MHKFFWIALAAITLNTFSAPLYYTFTGKVSLIAMDKGGNAAAFNITVGSPVSYVFVVDTAAPGFTKNLGIRTDKNDIVNAEYSANYFLDSLFKPSLFSPVVNDMSSGSYFGYHTITKLGTVNRYGLALQTTIGDANNFTQIIIYLPDSGSVDFMPKVGAKVLATEEYSSTDLAATSVSLSLTLTAISLNEPANGLKRPTRIKNNWMRLSYNQEFLTIENRSGHRANIQIMNMLGATVFNQNIGQRFNLPFANWSQGGFILQAKTGHGNSLIRQAINF